MPLRFSSAPGARQRQINDLLSGNLDLFCTPYLDNLFIWSERSMNDHFVKIDKALERLENTNIKLDAINQILR